MSIQTQDQQMGIGSVALFSLCAVIAVDTLCASAAIGVSSIGWWVTTLIIFIIPYGLITSELSASYPCEGGIYDWVKRAFGSCWAMRTTWFYWINVGLWMPAVYIMFAGVFSELFNLALSLFSQVAICIVLTWVTIAICNVSTNIGVWVVNISAVLKVAVILILGVGGFMYAAQYGIANQFSFSAMLPSFDSGIAFLPALVFNLMGFELVATMSKDMKDVSDMPKAIFLAIGITAFLYIFGTLGILMALPVEDIGLVSGMIATLRQLFGDSVFGSSMVYIVGTMILLSFIGNMVTWTMGAGRAAVEAAREGELPQMIGHLHEKYHTPSGANKITGIVSTTVIAFYALFAQNSDGLFWSVFAFSSCIFLIPYLFMFPAYLKLRLSDLATPRTFKVPGNMLVQYTLTTVCFLVIVQALILFIFPALIDFSIDWRYSAPVLSGVIVTILVGEYMLKQAELKKGLRVKILLAQPIANEASLRCLSYRH